MTRWAPPHASALASAALSVVPDDRPDLAGVIRRLSHRGSCYRERSRMHDATARLLAYDRMEGRARVAALAVHAAAGRPDPLAAQFTRDWSTVAWAADERPIRIRSCAGCGLTTHGRRRQRCCLMPCGTSCRPRPPTGPRRWMRDDLRAAGLNADGTDSVVDMLVRDPALLEAASLVILQAGWEDQISREFAQGALGAARSRLPVVEAALIAIVTVYGK